MVQCRDKSDFAYTQDRLEVHSHSWKCTNLICPLFFLHYVIIDSLMYLYRRSEIEDFNDFDIFEELSER